LQTIGVICEYNPFHLGHKKQMDTIRAHFGEEATIICLMSGNFVQRGHPAIFDKMARAEAALLCGADLVLELPIPYALSSAEGFATGGVAILSKLCTHICFGAEDADPQNLMQIAAALLSPQFKTALRTHLDAGLSFPVARQQALQDMGMDGAFLETPNNILAIEYCKAILTQNSALQIFPIHRGGSYHDTHADHENPSATAVRKLITENSTWASFVPQATLDVWKNAAVHNIASGENAILAKLRTMTDTEFEALPYGSEGLWRKFMHACRKESSLEEILAATKSKRYTRTRLDRMAMCAFLGLSQTDLSSPAPYVRILGFNRRGRSVLNAHKEETFLRNIGEDTQHPYQALEQRCTALYGLFADKPGAPDAESRYRMIVK
jgi:predicted nucleotidyltransferase